MRYLMLLCDVESEQKGPGDPGFDEMIAAYAAFDEMVKETGVFLASGKLQPTSRATTVRLRDGQTTTHEGPFALTPEQVGGFYLLECRDHAHALELAAQIPTAQGGSIEVRPLFA